MAAGVHKFHEDDPLCRIPSECRGSPVHVFGLDTPLTIGQTILSVENATPRKTGGSCWFARAYFPRRARGSFRREGNRKDTCMRPAAGWNSLKRDISISRNPLSDPTRRASTYDHVFNLCTRDRLRGDDSTRRLIYPSDGERNGGTVYFVF